MLHKINSFKSVNILPFRSKYLSIYLFIDWSINQSKLNLNNLKKLYVQKVCSMHAWEGYLSHPTSTSQGSLMKSTLLMGCWRVECQMSQSPDTFMYAQKIIIFLYFVHLLHKLGSFICHWIKLWLCNYNII